MTPSPNTTRQVERIRSVIAAFRNPRHGQPAPVRRGRRTAAAPARKGVERRWSRVLSPTTARRRLDSAEGALLGTFVGDALGMPYEGRGSEEIPAKVEMVDARLGRGTYTDDTEMMIALAEAIIEQTPLDAEQLAARFLDRFDPARGYGGGTVEVFRLWRLGMPVAAASRQVFDTQGSWGNGAAMRIAPVAIRFADTAPQLLTEARTSAFVTHAHPLGTDAAVVQAATVGAAIGSRDVLAAAQAAAATDALRAGLEQVRELLGQHPSPREVAAQLGSSSAGHRSVPAAVYCALAHDGFEQALSFAVRCGGDTDTVGAMTGAIAGARFGASAIPDRWLACLEDGRRGRSYVQWLAAELHGLAMAAR